MCKKQKYLNGLTESDAQNTAFCLRTPQRLLVAHGDLVGNVQIDSYVEFLNKPYINCVMARQIENPPLTMLETTTNFVAELQEIKKINQESGSDIFNSLWRSKLIKMFN